MTGPEPNLPPAIPVSPAAAWLTLNDELLRAINHELSNRLAALGSVSHLLAYNQNGLGSLPDVLAAEIKRLEGTLALLRLLPRNPGEAAEPVRISDLLPSVLALHRLQSYISAPEHTVDQQADVLPVWLPPSILVRTLLLLLSAAARTAEQWEDARVSIRCHGDAEFVTLSVETEVTEPGNTDVRVAETQEGATGATVDAVEALLRGTGGELRVARFNGSGRQGIRFELRLPTLIEHRRRERSG